LIVGRTLYVFSVGDSRVVLGRHRGEEVLSDDLSDDHKPDRFVRRRGWRVVLRVMDVCLTFTFVPLQAS
jgi:serine/threonine protein phosphatase PrpC